MIRIVFLIIEFLSFGLVSLGSVAYTSSFIEPDSYHHKNLISLDTRFPELNNHSLSEVFEDVSLFNSMQLVNNGDFSDDFTVPVFNAVGSISNGTYKFTATSTNGRFQLPATSWVSNDRYYIASKYKTNSSDVVLHLNGFRLLVGYSVHSGDDTFQLISGLTYGNTFLTTIGVMDLRSSNWTEIEVEYIYRFNVTTLITNKQYSPMFDTTFDLMTDAQVISQMNEFIEKPYLTIDLISLGIDTLSLEQIAEYYSMYDDLKNDIPHYIYTTYDVTKTEITLNDILAMFSSVAIWYFIIKMIRGLLP